MKLTDRGIGTDFLRFYKLNLTSMVTVTNIILVLKRRFSLEFCNAFVKSEKFR